MRARLLDNDRIQIEIAPGHPKHRLLYAAMQGLPVNGNGSHATDKLTRADFGYREADDAEVSCARCLFYRGPQNDGTGTCMLYKRLGETLPDTFSLLMDAGANMTCDAWQEHLTNEEEMAEHPEPYQRQLSVGGQFDDGRELALFYAQILEDSQDAEGQIDFRQYQDAQDELAHTPWTVEISQDGRFSAQKKPVHEFSSVQFDMPLEVKDAIRGLAEEIPDEVLVQKGRVDDLHITALFGLHTASPEPVRDMVSDFGTVRIGLGPVAFFPDSGKGDVIVVEVFGPKLHALHNYLRDNLENTQTHDTYVPHISLGYVQPGKGAEVAAKLRDHFLIGLELDLHTLTFSGSNGEKAEIGIDGTGYYQRTGHAILFYGKRAPAGYTRAKPLNIGGKAFIGGQWIPDEDLAKATPEQKKLIEDAEGGRKAKREEKLAGWKQKPVDVPGMMERLKDKRLSEEPDLLSAKRAFGTLKRYHQEYVVHRLEELEGQSRKSVAWVEKRLGNVEKQLQVSPKDAKLLEQKSWLEGVKERQEKQLSRISHMVDWAHEAGHTGKIDDNKNVAQAPGESRGNKAAGKGVAVVLPQRNVGAVEADDKDKKAVKEKADEADLQARPSKADDQRGESDSASAEAKAVDTVHGENRGHPVDEVMPSAAQKTNAKQESAPEVALTREALSSMNSSEQWTSKGKADALKRADQWRAETEALPVPDELAVVADAASVVKSLKTANPMADPAIPDVYKAVKSNHPSITPRQFSSALLKMKKDGSLKIGGYTGPLADLASPEHAIPTGHEIGYYLSPGKGKTIPGKWLSGGSVVS